MMRKCHVVIVANGSEMVSRYLATIHWYQAEVIDIVSLVCSQ